MNQNYKKTLLKLLVGTLGASTFGVNAQTSEVVSSNLAPSKKSQTYLTESFAVPGSVTNVGSESSNLKPIKGYANDLPAIEVLKQITPHGWAVKKDDSAGKVNLDKHVSWSGGTSWNNVLQNICQNYNYNAVVNWEKRIITISNSVNSSNSKNSIFQLEGANTPTNTQQESNKVVIKETVTDSKNKKKLLEEDVVIDTTKPAEVIVEEKIVEKTKLKDGKKVQEVVKAEIIVPEVKAQPSQFTYKLVGTKSLKENVAIWAAKAGYRLVWSGEDYPVVDSQIVAGLFDADDGPIQSLSVDYGQDSRVQKPLSFVFYKNKTLVVEDVQFEQSGFPQYSKK